MHANLELGSYLSEAKERRIETLKCVYKLFPILEQRKKQLAGTLSGGEQQMLAIARSLMCIPKLLMIDEPSLGLMPTLVDAVFKSIEDLNKQGITVLLVEQSVYDTLTLAHRAYVLETMSEITLEGKAKDVLQNEYVRTAYLGL